MELKFKKIPEVFVGMTKDGRIYIDQFDDISEESFSINFTFDQFKEICNWVNANKEQICKAWNGGVLDD